MSNYAVNCKPLTKFILNRKNNGTGKPVPYKSLT